MSKTHLFEEKHTLDRLDSLNMDEAQLEFFGPRQVGALELWEDYSALLRAGFDEDQSLALIKVMLATNIQLNAGAME